MGGVAMLKGKSVSQRGNPSNKCELLAKHQMWLTTMENQHPFALWIVLFLDVAV
jgi:hypothetical protein